MAAHRELLQAQQADGERGASRRQMGEDLAGKGVARLDADGPGAQEAVSRVPEKHGLAKRGRAYPFWSRTVNVRFPPVFGKNLRQQTKRGRSRASLLRHARFNSGSVAALPAWG